MFRRITSYNVCYTKLLRTFALNQVSDTAIFLNETLRDSVKYENLYKYFKMTAIPSKPATKSIKYIAVTDVITSYSIHYTKLYED